MWLMDKRYYIFALWVLGWIVPTILRMLDAIKSADSIPKGTMLTIVQTLEIQLSQILPWWSWELNKQWVELGIFRPSGLMVSSILIILFIIQYMREASAIQEREYKVQRTDY